MPNQTYPASVPTPKTEIASTTPNDAPALMPRMRGSARGLRVSAWNSTPATASASPTARPSAVRGIRSSRTMVLASPPSGATSACQTWSTPSCRLPSAKLASTASKQHQRSRRR